MDFGVVCAASIRGSWRDRASRCSRSPQRRSHPSALGNVIRGHTTTWKISAAVAVRPAPRRTQQEAGAGKVINSFPRCQGCSRSRSRANEPKELIPVDFCQKFHPDDELIELWLFLENLQSCLE